MLVIVTVLALLASSVSACMCSHHKVEATPEAPSCHQHAEMAMTDNDTNCFSSDDDCVCAFASEQSVAKSEAIKLKKQVALAGTETPVFATSIEIQPIVKIGFITPSHFAAPLDDLSSSRGPPRL